MVGRVPASRPVVKRNWIHHLSTTPLRAELALAHAIALRRRARCTKVTLTLTAHWASEMKQPRRSSRATRRSGQTARAKRLMGDWQQCYAWRHLGSWPESADPLRINDVVEWQILKGLGLRPRPLYRSDGPPQRDSRIVSQFSGCQRLGEADGRARVRASGGGARFNFQTAGLDES